MTKRFEVTIREFAVGAENEEEAVKEAMRLIGNFLKVREMTPEEVQALDTQIRHRN